ncbi:DEAD-box ATP-dependent RNA helicase 7 [Nymphaea colorata]|nr:DEAD-box ATP-dependent RNA helicase 7 [Nymphaea colorata]
MPALRVSDPFFSSGSLEMKEEKKMKKKVEGLPETVAPLDMADLAKKKKKKNKEEALEREGGDLETKKKTKKESKKRKVAEEDDDGETSTDRGEDTVARKEPKKMKLGERSSSDEESEVVVDGDGEEDNPNAVSNFRISSALRERLKSKGIESLFPIQAMTFDTIFDGSDLVGRAKTGQGKTLAFVLPILESLINGQNKASRKTGYGRSPSVLVLAPTRELAKQVHADFEFYGQAMGLMSCCLYGGSPYHPQEFALKRGVDIVVGTPGRMKDHIERQNIDLRSLKFRVLDEADEMLNMGFVDDVENILGKVEDLSKVQTLLFSATMPDWVKKIASRFLKPDKQTADLVGDDKMKASTNVRHIVLPCFHSARQQIIPDIIRCYSSGGRTIVFTETKNSASELAGLLPGARALHGDIQQATREVTLAGFRSGKFMVLVATDVAARGLDINDVQLIVQCEPPRDVETYIHRSGRTGRAGNTGVAVMLYDRKKSYMIPQIEKVAGVNFERISAPQPADIAKASGSAAAETVSNISDSVIPVFQANAQELLNSSGLSAVDIVAKALAKIAGYTEIKSRSLLTCQDNYVTMLLQAGRTMYTHTYAYGILRRFLPEEKVIGFRGLSLTADGQGAVFDVPKEDVDLVLAGQENADMVSVEVLDTLPPLEDAGSKGQGRGGDGWRGRGRDSFGGSGGGFSNRSNGGFSSRSGGGFSSRGGRGGGGFSSRSNRGSGGFQRRPGSGGGRGGYASRR